MQHRQAFDPHRHEPLSLLEWSDSYARSEIEDIEENFSSSRLPDGSWPTHEREDLPNRPHWCQYNGAAGVVVAMRLMGRKFIGYDLTEDLPRIHAKYIDNPDHGYEPGYKLARSAYLRPQFTAESMIRNWFCCLRGLWMHALIIRLAKLQLV